eukprot:sb/3462899/
MSGTRVGNETEAGGAPFVVFKSNRSLKSEPVLILRIRGESPALPSFHSPIMRAVLCLILALHGAAAEVISHWDLRDELKIPVPGIKPVASRCTPSAVTAVLTSLEISMARVSGTYQGLSKQEVVDCYGDSCFAFSAERTRKVAEWLERRGRLAPEDKYAEYKGDRKACKSNPAPNALHNWSIKGVRRITPDQFEDAIKETRTPIYRKPDLPPSIPLNRGPTISLVGYGEEDGVPFYWARWMERSIGDYGYMRFRRGNNACGLDNYMEVVESGPKDMPGPPTVNPETLCPLDMPVYCPKTKTCRTEEQECLDIQKDYLSVAEKAELPEKCKDKRPWCSRVTKRHCAKPTYQRYCPGSCKMCDANGNPNCKDSDISSLNITFTRRDNEKVEYTDCTQLKEAQYCISTAVQMACEVSCNVNPVDCGRNTSAVILDKLGGSTKTRGRCYLPVIENGRAINEVAEDGTIEAGTKLKIECDEGYELAGEANICMIQNVYIPDSRRRQWCKPVSEARTGFGADYQGSQSTTMPGNKCANWAELAENGAISNDAEARSALANGNHNFCRNNNNDAGPWCYLSGSTVLNKEYCFPYNACDAQCGEGETRRDRSSQCGYLVESRRATCELFNSSHLKKYQWMWNACPVTCSQ